MITMIRAPVVREFGRKQQRSQHAVLILQWIKDLIALGVIKQGQQATIGVAGRGPNCGGGSSWTDEHIHLIAPLIKLISTDITTGETFRDFLFNSIAINWNVSGPVLAKNKGLLHTHPKNIGTSLIMTLGDFVGGLFAIGTDKDTVTRRLCVFKTWTEIDGAQFHGPTPFEGDRISIVVFSQKCTDDHLYLKELGFGMRVPDTQGGRRRAQKRKVVHSDVDVTVQDELRTPRNRASRSFFCPGGSPRQPDDTLSVACTVRCAAERWYYA